MAHFLTANNNNEKRGFTASQEIGQTTFVLKKKAIQGDRTTAIDNHHTELLELSSSTKEVNDS